MNHRYNIPTLDRYITLKRRAIDLKEVVWNEDLIPDLLRELDNLGIDISPDEEVYFEPPGVIYRCSKIHMTINTNSCAFDCYAVWNKAFAPMFKLHGCGRSEWGNVTQMSAFANGYLHKLTEDQALCGKSKTKHLGLIDELTDEGILKYYN